MGLHFSTEEFSNRKSKVIQSLKEQNIDALLMFRQESMYWLTGPHLDFRISWFQIRLDPMSVLN